MAAQIQALDCNGYLQRWECWIGMIFVMVFLAELMVINCIYCFFIFVDD